ncbi:MAG TPA: ACT domain-containing protein [Leptolyngbyaceae cyanobacterium M65_K2018_010]|nr:ACT domain-containing protein [Leptolyngbyaceae cyanobacterium M65_K2018_010]
MAFPLTLVALEGTFAIHRLDPAAEIPMAWFQQDFISLVRTPQELSLVVRETVAVPSQKVEPGWRGFVIQGTLAFSMTGILAAISQVLATAQISIFAISTYDTDYIFVQAAAFEAAVRALSQAGYKIEAR